MTVRQVEECRAATIVHKPRERTRTHSAPYSYTVGTCGPTCSCDIFGLESHSKSRLIACMDLRSTGNSIYQQSVAVTVVEPKRLNEQLLSKPTESIDKTIDAFQVITAEELKESDQLLSKNSHIDKIKLSKTRTATNGISTKGFHVAHPVQELLETEQDYVEHLVILVEVFLRRLTELPWISQEKKDAVARNAEDILKFQLNFLDLLEKACETSLTSNIVFPVAECFTQTGSKFSVYTEYCVQHESALKACKELSSKVEWQIFEQKAMMEAQQLSTQRKLQFQDFLIKPVQRICRYQLLLKEIGKLIRHEQENRTEIQEALRIMHSVVNSINTEKQKRDVALMTSRFIERLEGDLRLNKRSLQLLGNVIYSGALEMLSLHHINQKVKYYGCFLFSTYMVIVRAKKSTVYEPKHWFPLRQFSLQKLQDDDGYLSNSWLLVSGQHVFEFGASCPQEKQIWMKAIQDAIDLLHPEENLETVTPTRSMDEWPEDMLVSSLEQGVRSPSPKLRSRSLANIKDATSASATWKQICIKSPQNVIPKQSYSTPNSVANTPRLSQDVLFSKNTSEDLQSDGGSYSETCSNERKESTELDTKFVLIASSTHLGYSNIDSTGKGKFKSPKSAHKESRKAVVDQKFLDVSTQEVLTAKALSAHEKGMTPARARRLSFGKSSPKPSTVPPDNCEDMNAKLPMSRRQSHEAIVRKLRSRSSDIAGNQHTDLHSLSMDNNTRNSHNEEQPLTANKEISPVGNAASPGFFEKVIDKFSAISSPHRQRPPAIKINLPRISLSESVNILHSASAPTSASSTSSVGMDAHFDVQDNSNIHPERRLSESAPSEILLEEEKFKRTKRSSQPVSSTCDRESSKLPSWMRTPVSRRRRDSKLKQ